MYIFLLFVTLIVDTRLVQYSRRGAYDISAYACRRYWAGAGKFVAVHLMAVFSFLYFLKIKISKIYIHFEIFQKYPPVAPHRATGLKCKFFFQIRNEVPGKKKPCRPPTGDRGLSPSPRATAAGPSPPRGRPGYPPYKSSSPPLLI